MGLFKGMAASKERQKAKAFFDNGMNEAGSTRDTRKMKAVLGNRTRAFIDLTFIEGAQKTQKYIEALDHANATGGKAPQKPVAASYKEVRTVGGKVWVYLPQHYTNQFFSMGSRYQQNSLTRNRAVQLATHLATELSEELALDHPISPLEFLVNEVLEDQTTDEVAEEDEPNDKGADGATDEEASGGQTHESP